MHILNIDELSIIRWAVQAAFRGTELSGRLKPTPHRWINGVLLVMSNNLDLLLC